MSVINDYEEVLIGNKGEISKDFFAFDRKGNQRVALSVFKYAIEKLLKWDAKRATELFNESFMHLMKLDQMANYIIYPSDVSPKDTEYILHLLYPKEVQYELKKYTIRIYKEVMAGKRRYPKDYMFGYLGLLRAKICLQYSLVQTSQLFKTTDELYKFFASPECIKYLKKNRLLQLCDSFYNSPLEYMYDSVPTDLRNEFLFHNYMFEIKFRKLTENSGGKKVQEKKEEKGKEKEKEICESEKGSKESH